MNFKAVLGIILTPFLGLASSLVQAEMLKLVSGDDYPPFTGSKLVNGGALTQLVEQAFADSNRTVDVYFKPWPRAYREALRLEYDAAFPYLYTPQRAEEFLFSDSLYEVNLRLYVPEDSHWQTGTQQELENAVFCLPSGYEVSGWVQEDSQQLNFITPRTMEQCHDMLKLGRVDVLISNPHEMAWRSPAAMFIPPYVRMLPEPLDDTTLHLIISRAHPHAQQLMDRFNAGLQDLISSGARDRLLRQNPDYRRSLDAGKSQNTPVR